MMMRRRPRKGKYGGGGSGQAGVEGEWPVVKGVGSI